jgi:STE24 endopeptidase
MHRYQILILAAYVLVTGFDYWLTWINLRHLKKQGLCIPAEFEGEIDEGLLRKTIEYTIDNTRLGLISSAFDNIILLVFFFGGLLNIYNRWIASLNLPFILTGIVFFMILFYAESLLSIPFSLYKTFRIERGYGFSTMTLRLWTSDFVKSILISTVLLCILISAGLLIIQKSPRLWWLWLWCFFLVFGIFIMYISPYIIEPLFHKFTPLGDEYLEGRIRALMQKAGIEVSRVFKMDASRRTRHTNAYFTGIGRVKRIVLFDTLLNRMNHDEILSVLAHEAGHWKRRHLLKQIFMVEVLALIGLYASYHILKSDILLDIFRIEERTFFAKVVILGLIGSIVSFPLTPVFNMISRRHEDEADGFSFKLTGDRQGMISALKKLSKDNLSNLHPHPVYAFFHYSHPPVIERIRRIKSFT